MSDSISNSPRNGALGALSDALQWLKDKGNKVDLVDLLRRSPIAPGLANAVIPKDWKLGAGDMTVGKAPDEVNEWSYGNAPMRLPPSGTGGYVPAFKQGRAESTLDSVFAGQAGLGLGRVAGAAGKSGLRAMAENLRNSELTPSIGSKKSQLGAVRLKGGNFNEERLDEYLTNIGIDALPGAGTSLAPATNSWGAKQLRNYIRKDLGTPTDPLLAVEKEYPNLHLPETSMVDPYEDIMHRAPWGAQGRPGMYAKAHEYLEKHKELSGGQPLTPWGAKSDSMLESQSIPSYTHELQDVMNMEVPGWLQKTDPNAKIWAHPPGIIQTQEGSDPLQFAHVLDYLEAAQEPHRTMRGLIADADPVHGRNFIDRVTDPAKHPEADAELMKILETGDPGMTPIARQQIERWQRLHNAGLTLTPEQVARTSVADAVRKTAQWNNHLAENMAATGDLHRGIAEVHKDYGDGMKWVRLGNKPAEHTLDALPEGYRLNTRPDGQSAIIKENDRGHIFGDYASSPEEALRKFNIAQGGRLELEAGLNAEGEAMGHCVGGYCDDVADRGTQIYSLRDAKNNPHVTVEVRPGRVAPWDPIAWINKAGNGGASQQALNDLGIKDPWRDQPRGGIDAIRNHPEYKAYKAQNDNAPMDIDQIKGKQNQAPVEKYQPYVQDFVKNGKWGEVSDLENADMYEIGGRRFTSDEVKAAQSHYLDHGTGDYPSIADFNQLSRKDPSALSDLDRTALAELGFDQFKVPGPGPTPGYAHGGSVQSVPKFSRKAALLARIQE